MARRLVLDSDVIFSNLVQIRKEKNLSQHDLALRLRIDPGNMCKYEKGFIRPSIDFLCCWCRALGYGLTLMEM